MPGIILWQELRHLHAWADPAVRDLAALFHVPISPRALALRREARAGAGEIAPALLTFQGVVTGPIEADRAQVARACSTVVAWAVERDHVETAIEYAEAGANADAENPEWANLAGRTTRNAHEYDRAEVWFKRGIGFAREQENLVELARGHLGLGILHQDLRRVRKAAKHLHAGAKAARKQGLKWLTAEAAHDLMLLLTVNGQHAAAEDHARLALRWYGSGHPRFPLFAADVALLLVLERHYGAAARITRAVLRHVTQPAARSVILALQARALVGAGYADELDRHGRRVRKILRDYREKEAVALWHMAAAERAATRWEAAETTAARGHELASSVGDRETARLTARLLAGIRARKPSPPPKPLPAEHSQLIEEISVRLGAWAPRHALSPLRAKWVA